MRSPATQGKPTAEERERARAAAAALRAAFADPSTMGRASVMHVGYSRPRQFGGTLKMRDLDARAYGRVMIALGSVNPGPAPTVEGAPGMVTQAQANVIWRLWQDARTGRDATDGALDVAIGLLLGLPGGLDTLTRAGARAVMDAFRASMDEHLDLAATRPSSRTIATKSNLPC